METRQWVCIWIGAVLCVSLFPQESEAQDRGRAGISNGSSYDLRRGAGSSSTPQAKTSFGNVELEEGRGGRLSCLLKITLEEGNPWVSRTAEYRFEAAGDGRQHRLEFGPKIPIQSTINNSISVILINSGTTVSVRARFAKPNTPGKRAEVAWFALEIEYARILERLATFANLPSVPYRDFNQITTNVLIPADHEQELYNYDDDVIGRKLRISFRWAVAEGPESAERIASKETNSLRYTLTMTDGERRVKQSYLATIPSPYQQSLPATAVIGSFTSGVQIPVETQINNTKSIQYIGQGVGAEITAPRQAASGSSEYFDIPMRVHYQRLRERAFAAQSEIPYTESVEFEAAPKLAERQEADIFQSSEGIRGKTFKAGMSWHRETE